MITKPAIIKLHSLGKNERLKSHKVITKLFKEGESFSVFPFRVLFLLSSPATHPAQAGFSVSSRNFKKAVDRNRIKRLMKEAYRLNKHGLISNLTAIDKQVSVFFIYTGHEIPDYAIVTEKMKSLLDALIKKINPVLKNK